MVTPGQPAHPAYAVGDHACWIVDGPEDRQQVLDGFFADGARRGEQLVYVGDAASLGAATQELAGDGLVRVQPPAPLALLAGRLPAWADAAAGAGRRALRVAIDATSLVGDGHDRQTYLSQEIALDRLVANASIVALCCLDHGVLGPAAAEIACVHRHRHTPDPTADPGFCLYTVGRHLVVTGEIDLANHELFADALEAAASTAAAEGLPELVVDLAALDFVDVLGASRLRDFACRPRSGTYVRVDDRRGLVANIARALDWPELLLRLLPN